MPHQLTRYSVQDRRGALAAPLRVVILSDLHNGPYDDILPALRGVDAILAPGDLLNRHRAGTDLVARFLAEAPAIAPTYISLGNHDWRSAEADNLRALLAASRARLLDNETAWLRPDVAIGGLSSAPKGQVDASVVDTLSHLPGYRLLLCHHPEYYPHLVQGREIDLTLSGHAHGGQWEVFGRGLYAPGQGFLPRLTAGWYDGQRLLVSRGMTNSAGLPRLHNPCEALLLDIRPMRQEHP